MDWHGTMRRPIVQFARLAPFQNEGYANFAWRLRKLFQELPRQPHFDSAVRDMLFEAIKTYIPSVWSAIQPKIRMPTAQLVEEMVIQAGIIAHMPIEQAIYSKAGSSITLQGQSAPYYQYEISPATPGAPGKAQIIQPNALETNTGLSISDTRKDDQKAHVTTDLYKKEMLVGYMKCYKCGKMGHIAKDCTQKKKGLYNGRTVGATGGNSRAGSSGAKSEQVTIKGTLFYENKPRAFSQQVRSQFRKMVTRKPTSNRKDKNRAYTSGAPEIEDEELAPSEDWRDDDVDGLIEQILMSVEQDQDEENNE